jgi:sugar phosphate permease
VVGLLYSNPTKKKILTFTHALISWYKRSELGSRIAVFFSAATVAGAFSGYITFGQGKLIDRSKQRYRSGGLLAAAIHNMDGIGGRPGWAWIFILEGLFTILVACASPWVVQDFPESARFLTEAERMCTTTPTLRHADRHIRRCVHHPRFKRGYAIQR